MPRTKKQIEIVTHMPLEKNKEEFQKRVNQVFVYSVKDNLGKTELNGEKKKEIVKRVEEIIFKDGADTRRVTVLP
ncbi:hypothetical protein AALA00_02945 [Lachnospiraceae bacterium 46-15]